MIEFNVVTETADRMTRRRIEFSMSPLYVVDLLTVLEIASASDPTTAAAVKRLNVAIRASGYTKQTLEDAAVEELEERIGKDCVIAEDR